MGKSSIVAPLQWPRGGAADEVTPCDVDPQQWWPLPQRYSRQKLGLHLSKFILLQVGRLAPSNGIDTAIDSMALLRQQRGIDTVLIMVGADSADASERDACELHRLRTVASRRGVAEHVLFTGSKERAELRYFYNAADIFVCTPWYQPCAATVVEAMACARPVIGADVGSLRSTVLDGVTGFLVPARDAQAVADRLALLHANPALARTMGEHGMRRAHQHFTWQSMAQQEAANRNGDHASGQHQADG